MAHLTWLQQVRCFLLDMDGTFYLGDRLLPGAAEFLQALRVRGLPFLFLTNNSSRSAPEWAAKLQRLGVQVEAAQVFTSGEATGRYLARRSPGARVYLVGTPSLRSELEAHGLRVVEQGAECAVLGFDTTLTYAKLHGLCDRVRAGLPYLATHPDINCPTERGLMPDVGAMIAFVEASTGRRPDIIIGKPYAPMVEALCERTCLAPHQLCTIGDRLYTDIALGQHGLRTVLVLSGEAQATDLAGSPWQPDQVVRDLWQLVGELWPPPGGQEG